MFSPKIHQDRLEMLAETMEEGTWALWGCQHKATVTRHQTREGFRRTLSSYEKGFGTREETEACR